MAVRYLLDTNIVAFHLRRSSPALQQRMRSVDAADAALSVVTEMEIRFGLARHPGLRIAPLVEQLLAGITILPLTSAVAPVYGDLRAKLEASGRPVGPLDLMIAAHARSLGLVLVSNNLRELGRIPGLACEDWTV